MRSLVAACCAAFVFACGGKAAVGTAGEAADAGEAGAELTCSQSGTAQRTCSNGTYSVTIVCGSGGVLVCRSPLGSFTKPVQGNLCGEPGYDAAFVECGFPR